MTASIAEHRRIIAALATNNGAKAKLEMEMEMEAHIRNTAQCAGLEP